jgi:hypothetical protein
MHGSEAEEVTQVSYDPRAIPCIDPTTTEQEMIAMGYRTTREKEIDRKAYFDDVRKRYEAREAQKKADRKADAKREAKREARRG